MGDIFTLSLCCAPGKKHLHMYGAPTFVAATQGMPLDHLPLEARVTCIPGHMGL